MISPAKAWLSNTTRKVNIKVLTCFREIVHTGLLAPELNKPGVFVIVCTLNQYTTTIIRATFTAVLPPEKQGIRRPAGNPISSA